MSRIWLLLIIWSLVTSAQAQPCGGLRYQQRVFAQSYKSSNIVYGNAPSLPTTVYLGEGVTQNVDLTLDVYEPFGDTLRKRPLVILSFGGAFLIGSKDDEDIQSVSDSLARRGYVAACINYRLGMNVADAVSCERAIYRALQDFSAAVRYFKQHANQYGIDTNYIYVGGVSAGGFAALHMALVDESDRPASTFSAGGISPRPDLGCKDCSGNNYAHSSNVRGVINYWGAIGDVNWIKPGTAKPLVSFHGDQDLIVPYNTGFPFTALATLPQVSGSGAIKQRYDQIGAYNEHYVFPGEGHNIWGLMVMNQFTPGPNQYYLPIYEGTSKFLLGQCRPEVPTILGADTVCLNVETVYSISPSPSLKYCWQSNGGHITQQSGHEVRVRWQSAGTGYLYATTTNQLDAVSVTDTLNVWVHDPVSTVIIAPEGGTTCSGNSLPLLASTGASLYEWAPPQYYSNAAADSTVLTPLISGLYYLHGTDSNGCRSRDSLYVTVLPPPVAPVILQLGDSLYAQAGTGAVNWYDADSNLLASGGGFTPVEDGIYSAAETALNGCESPWAIYQYLGTHIGELGTHHVQAFPNPVNDEVVIVSDTPGLITLYDAVGAKIYENVIHSSVTIGLAYWPMGIYYYNLTTPAGTVRGKLIKQ